jgi:cytochrome c biogenesis protein
VRTGTAADGRTMVEYGLLARGEDHRLAGEAAALRKLFSAEWQLPDDNAAEVAASDGIDPETTAGSQQTPSRPGDNVAGSVSTPAGPTGPEKDQ